MEHASEWTATVYLEDHDRETHARARLDTGDNQIEGVGSARRSPRDRDIPEIGRELATARALSDLAHKLFEATVDDIESSTHETATIRS